MCFICFVCHMLYLLTYIHPHSPHTVEKLQIQWEDSHRRLTERIQELQKMSEDSVVWLNAKNGVELHLKKAQETIKNWKEICYTVDLLKIQNNDLKVTKIKNYRNSYLVLYLLSNYSLGIMLSKLLSQKQ